MRWLVVAAEPVTGVDVTAGDTVAELDKALHAMGIEFCFAELKDPVKDKLKDSDCSHSLARSTSFRQLAQPFPATSKFMMWTGRTGRTKADIARSHAGPVLEGVAAVSIALSLPAAAG